MDHRHPIRGIGLQSAVIAVLAVSMLASCAPNARILYSGSLNGNLLGCDCWGYPEAGLDKRAWYLAEQEMQPGDLLLDAGNILEEGRQPFLAELILETYRELGYDAVAIGLNELAEGPDALADRAAGIPGPTLLSHNLLLDGHLLTEEPVLFPVGDPGGGETLALISLADPLWFEPYLHLSEGRLTVADPAEILEASASKVQRSGGSAIILLAHGREDWIRRLVDSTSDRLMDRPPIVAVIVAGEEKLIEEKLPGGIPLLSPGEEGNRLGILEVSLTKKPRWKNEFIEFHYLGPGDERIAARGREYAEYLDSLRSE